MRFLFFLIVVFIPFMGCQSNRKAIKAERQAERVRKAQEREALKAYDEGLERHLSLQTSETLERMKENRKKSQKWLKPKQKEPFYKRWFKRKR